MPRYYRRRYTRTLTKPKKKWASNFCDVASFEQNQQNNVALDTIICKNSAQNALPTPVIVKTGNFKAQLDVLAAPTNAHQALVLTAYIIYVPEGMVPTGTYAANFNAWSQIIDNHPEWVIAWKLVSADSLAAAGQNANYDRVQFSSRLKRNLNSGDSIMFVLMSVGASDNVAVRGKIQFWTCAN